MGLEGADPKALSLKEVNPEIAFHCAFNFPAVLKALGAA